MWAADAVSAATVRRKTLHDGMVFNKVRRGRPKRKDIPGSAGEWLQPISSTPDPTGVLDRCQSPLRHAPGRRSQ